ncbi:hypothetical protein PVAND_012656 [Polypedilum vanderplanki]|uniref:MADF domain-containing protein n=1 Tax=Polypedilum vanderplanki TaxID=319348 RepID=A0A9J6CP04_POLVA|nr:hypothetical protein PVAND_012656 [Polypedilum vanderplanki]
MSTYPAMDEHFEQLTIILVQQHILTQDEDIFQLMAAKFQIPFKLIKSKFDNMKRQYRRYIHEERQLTKWMSFYSQHIKWNQIAPSTEIQMDIDAEIVTKSSNLTQPSEVENDEKFHKFIEFLERELKKRPEVVRNNFIHMNQAFLYDNPVQE